jgi:GNAT superfamily N-acetyltransferase
MEGVRSSVPKDRASILSIINEAAQAYRGVIPADRWHDPYMSAKELEDQIDAGVEFWCYAIDAEVIGVMGLQRVQDVVLIRHAYIRAGAQRRGVGGALITHLRAITPGRMLVGTWASAHWAIAFYQRHSFHLIERAMAPQVLQKYWNIPQRQIEESVVLESAKKPEQ